MTTHARVLAMPIAERIALSLALGDEDAARYARMAGISVEEARRELQGTRAHGRRRSVGREEFADVAR